MSGLPDLERNTTEAFKALWEKLFNEGDHVSMAEHYTEDAVLIASQMETVTGRAAVARFWRLSCERANAAGIQRSVNIDEQHTDGGLGYLRGTVVLTIPDRPEPIVTRYVTVWRRQPNGEWQIEVDISSVEPQTASTGMPAAGG